MKTILFVFGTRPEAIKIMPVILKLKSKPQYRLVTCVTAQHRLMLDQMLDFFKIKPDYDLSLMRKNQSLEYLTASIITRISEIIRKIRPDLLLIQGDTTSSMAGALAAYYQKIPIAHIEAGLRSGNKYQPFPEEINRKIITQLSDLNFAPTEKAAKNLLSEGVDKKKVFVTGNTVLDALSIIINSKNTFSKKTLVNFPYKKYILLTAHRRENIGQNLIDICQAVKILANKYPHVGFIYPVHLNPKVNLPVRKILGNIKNVFLPPPLEYPEFISLLSKAYLVLTDSGGVQEEAPAFHVPILILRETTERPEGVINKCAKIIGTQKEKIISEVKKLLTNQIQYQKMSACINPYGDGNSAQRIIAIIDDYLSDSRK